LPHGGREVGAEAAPSLGAGSREMTLHLWDVALQHRKGVRAGTASRKEGAQEAPSERQLVQARW